MLRPVTSEAHVLSKVGNSSAQHQNAVIPVVARSKTIAMPGTSARSRSHATTQTRSRGEVTSLGVQTKSWHSQPLIKVPFKYTDFARQLAHEPGATGAIAPSSKSLAVEVVKQANLTDAKTVVELGPGTGVFTEEILNNLRCDQLFFAIELNQAFVTATKTRCPGACVYNDAASALPQWLEKNNRTHADCIISSLPWTIFDQSDQIELMNAISDSLAPGGVFVSIIYLGAKFRSRGRHFINNLQHHFSQQTNTPTVWRNLPPTQIYRCIK